jgi:non-heme chloroperoxidase
MAPSVKSVELPSGVRLQYVEQGDEAGVPVLMLHGVTDSWRSFSPVLPHLPASIRAFALSQRGHGDSDCPVAAGYRTREFAADLAGFTTALGLGPVVVVGHSMGATNAKRFAIDHPERTSGLALIGAFASYRSNLALVEFWQSAVSRLTDPIAPAFAREFQESTLARPVPPAFLDLVVRESLKVPARVWRGAFAGFFEDDFADELAEIAAPTAIFWGDRDALARRVDQDALVASIPGSRLFVYGGTGHALHWEEPERFAADLTAFVTGLADADARSRYANRTALRDSRQPAR